MSRIDDIIKFESGEMNDKQTIKFFQKLIDTGECWQLQGSYGRMATELIESGVCKHAKKQHTDYYGNKVPTRAERSKK